MTSSAGSIIALLEHHNTELAAFVARRRGEMLRLAALGSAIVVTGAAGLGALIGGHAASAPVAIATVIALPIGIAFYAFRLGLRHSLAREIRRRSKLIGPLRSLATDSSLVDAERAQIAELFAAIEVSFKKAKLR